MEEPKPGLNAQIALLVTNGVGSMWCAYAFCLLALWGLPDAIRAHLVVAWVSQTFLQLVLLSVIMVGQNVQGLLAEARHQEQVDGQNRMIAHLELLVEELCAKEGVCLSTDSPAPEEK